MAVILNLDTTDPRLNLEHFPSRFLSLVFCPRCFDSLFQMTYRINESGTIIAHGLAMRPGSPVLIGKIDDCLIFCLPGSPTAAYLGFLTIAGPTLRKMMRCINIDPRIELVATIDNDVPVSTMGYVNHLRVRIKRVDNRLIATPIRLKGSGVISSLTMADGIIEIPPYQEGLKKGETVIVKLLPK